MMVKVRNEAAGCTHELGDVPFDQIDNVIKDIKFWGLSTGDDSADLDSLCGEFRHDEYGFYFLVMFDG